MRELAWVKAFPQIKHWHGFSPVEYHRKGAGGGQGLRDSPLDPVGKRRARSLTRMDADVPLQRPGVGELALAMDADIGLLPTVDPQVPLEVPCGSRQGSAVGHGDSSTPHPSFPAPWKLPWECLWLFYRGIEGHLAHSQGWGITWWWG